MKTRRLIGPLLITLISSGLLIDYIFFRDSPWSLVNFLSKIVAILVVIFGSALNPAVTGWLEKMALPLVTVGLAIVSISVLIARAKSAMSKVTPDADTPLFQTTDVQAPPEPSDLSEAVSFVTLNRRSRSGLLVKFTCAFVAVAVLFGVAVCIIVYSLFWRTSEKEFKAQADAISTVIAEVASRQLTSAGISQLRSDISKYASDGSVAYIYIEDARGEIIAQTPEDLPDHLLRESPSPANQTTGGTDVTYRGSSVFEVAKRLGDGKAEVVHVAFRRDLMEVPARGIIVPVAVSIFTVLIVAVGLFFVYVKRYVHRPLFQLVEHANRISKGEFAVQLGVARQDELGEIARSLERLRSSLRAMLTRLEKRPTAKP
ncbi:MAG: HAMP domain-containing protein [Chloroflexota bacterium]